MGGSCGCAATLYGIASHLRESCGPQNVLLPPQAKSHTPRKWTYTGARLPPVCAPCPADTYKNSVNASGECTACPPHAVSGPGSTSLAACECAPGFTGLEDPSVLLRLLHCTPQSKSATSRDRHPTTNHHWKRKTQRFTDEINSASHAATPRLACRMILIRPPSLLPLAAPQLLPLALVPRLQPRVEVAGRRSLESARLRGLVGHRPELPPTRGGQHAARGSLSLLHPGGDFRGPYFVRMIRSLLPTSNPIAKRGCGRTVMMGSAVRRRLPPAPPFHASCAARRASRFPARQRPTGRGPVKRWLRHHATNSPPPLSKYLDIGRARHRLRKRWDRTPPPSPPY
jgi:hypothetical protein